MKNNLIIINNDINGYSNNKITMGNLCEEWLCVNQNKFKEATYSKYYSMIYNHIMPFFNEIYISRINNILISNFTNLLKEQKKLSSKTIRDILTLLRTIIQYGCKYNPLLYNIQIVFPKEEFKEVRILTLEEQRILVNYLRDSDDPCKFGVLLGFCTGLRLGELCALKWKNISIEERKLNIVATMQRIKTYDSINDCKTKVCITTPKSKNSIRSIPINDSLIQLCIKYVSDNAESYILTGKSDKFIEPRTLQNKFSKYVKECNLENIHFHMLRHTFATRCIEAGFELKTLSEILGHSSPNITIERYVHSSMELKRKNMEKLNNFI